MIFRALKPKYKEKAVKWLHAAALLAFCLGVLMPKILKEQIAVALISGILLGFSIVGNLFCLYYHRSHRPEKSS